MTNKTGVVLRMWMSGFSDCSRRLKMLNASICRGRFIPVMKLFSAVLSQNLENNIDKSVLLHRFQLKILELINNNEVDGKPYQILKIYVPLLF